MSVRFVFSTRYHGENYVFSHENELWITSKVFELRRKNYLMGSAFVNMVQNKLGLSNEEIKSRIKKNCTKDVSLRALDTPEWKNSFHILPDLSQAFLKLVRDHEPELSDLPYDDKGMTIGNVIDGFSYFTIDNESTSPIYAVHCAKKASVDWVKALIEDAISGGGTDTGEENTLYLLLHDKDVPGYENQTFLILTPDQIDALNLGGEKKEKGWFYMGWKVNILVFNHVNNAAVELLKNKGRSAAEVIQGVKSIFNNNHKIAKLFTPSLSSDEKTQLFKELPKDSFVDLCNIAFSESGLTKQPNALYTVYLDNGAILTELMHVKPDLRASIQCKELVRKLGEKSIENSEMKNPKESHFPLIIKIYKSFFEDWANAKNDPSILDHPNKRAMEENLERVFSFYNNSSIWVRIIDYDENNKDEYNRAVAEFTYFDHIGLYDYPSAWENLNYHLRIFSENYLVSSLGGHGSYVNPMLYGDEVNALGILAYNSCSMNRIAEDDEPTKKKKGLMECVKDWFTRWFNKIRKS